MKISKIYYYGGARDKVCRLGLSHLFLEVQQIVLDTEVLLLPKKDANGAAVIREMLDKAFKSGEDWVNTCSGGVDWVKRIRYNNSIVARLGIEVQVSSRSDLLIRDIVHLRNSIQEGVIDVGLIIVPDEDMQRYLPDRTPSLRDALRYIEQEFPEAKTYPIVLFGISHDGESTKPLPKRRTNVGKEKNTFEEL